MVLTETNIPKDFSFKTLLTERFETDSLAEYNLINKITFFEFPATNILEDTLKFEILLAVPGLPKEAFRIKLENNVLEISSEQKEERGLEKVCKKKV
jgi:HSP20 family molecular chaperone IbpA